MSYPTSTFTVGLVQRSCTEDREKNLKRALEGVREAAAKGAQIVCLQEMFNATYFCKREDFAFFDIAEPILAPSGPTIRACQDAAKALKVVIVAPIFEKRAPGVFHNSAGVIDADGELLGVYRKMHIPDDPLYYEKFYFTPGDAEEPAPGTAKKCASATGYRVFETRYAKIAPLICWDQWYPENARIAALLGAEVLFYPTAIGWRPEEKEKFGEQHREGWQTIQQSHAVANELYVAAVNRTGHESEPGTSGIDFFGSSFVADPFGRVVAEAPIGEEHTLVYTCDRSIIESVRRHWPFFRDRRVDAFGPLTKRWIAQG